MTRRYAAMCSSVNQYTQLLIEAGPLAVFFVTNSQAGIMAGTGAFMAATGVAVLLSWHFERKLPIMPLVGCFFVLLFGGLTLWLEDDLFIKLKPTVVNLLFATVLFTSLALRRNVMKRLLGTVLSLTRDRLAYPDAALGLLLRRAGRAERGGLADHAHGCMGQLQGVRHHAADAGVQRAPDAGYPEAPDPGRNGAS